MDELPTLAFIHIPKTAGTSFSWILKNHCGFDRIYEINPKGDNTPRDFMRLSQITQERFDLIEGHMYFGIHRYIKRPVRYVTILRDPLERAISDLYHRSQVWTETEIDLEKIRISIASGGTSPYRCNDNIYVKRLCGRKGQFENYETVQSEELDERDFVEAMKNLQNYFLFVGITEHFAESGLLLADILKANPRFFPFLNRRSSRPTLEQIGGTAIHAFKERNIWDYQIYEYWKSRLNQEVERNTGNNQFNERLLRAKRNNKIVKFIPYKFFIATRALRRRLKKT